ncbi:MAG: hypothetical protein HOE08_02350 [Campylobacteraceae bacterium]|jgi:hypothetical protein|nr:hypothetical protein [Campylobacteraceae bacterium]
MFIQLLNLILLKGLDYKTLEQMLLLDNFSANNEDEDVRELISLMNKSIQSQKQTKQVEQELKAQIDKILIKLKSNDINL